MQEVRRARLKKVIQEELSEVIQRELKDPRVPPLTITHVEVTPDAAQATVYLLIQSQYLDEQNKEEQMRLCLSGLSSASGFLKRHIAKAINVKNIPNLIFKPDHGFENASRVYELLKEIKSDPRSAQN
jgi:ribosome-binding factor A